LAPSAIQSYVLPLTFEANQGQVDQQVKYLARGQGYTLFLTPNAAVLGLRSEGAGSRTEWLRLVLQGAVTAPAISGEGKLPSQANYFVGNDPARWRTNVPTFARVRYEQVYPGVDLVYYGRQGRLENDFEVNAGSDPKVISWQLQGAEQIHVDSTGNLVVTLGSGEVRLQQPRAYQVDGQQERDVPVHYRVHGQNVCFALGKYDRHQKLVIDPYLTYSTYLGGTGGDIAYSVVLDSSGDAYLTGVTASAEFPVTSRAYQTINNGGDGDVFVTEFNSTGSGIIFSTYLGGTGYDTASQIYLDNIRPNGSGNLFLVGSTQSANFPVTPTAFQPIYAGNQDAFLTEMKPDGSALIYSTYIGGTGEDFATALALDSSGNVYVTGTTASTDFPTLNPLQLGNDGVTDAFITEINPTSGALKYSTYLGGSSADNGTGIAIDSSGDVWVSGYTFSTNFPTQDAIQSTLGGGSDIFITEFKPGSPTLLFSTYLGGSSNDRSLAMAMDATGNIYLTGDTQSPNFPVTANAYQSTLVGTDNAFVMKLAPGASIVVFSTLFGGSGTGQATAIALDPALNIYITGFTQSENFPLVDAFQNTLGLFGAGNCGSTNFINVPPNTLCADAFVAKFSPSGLPVYSSYLGGSSTDSGQGIAVDSSGAAYVVGGTASPNFPATVGAYQWQYLGSTNFTNAFLAKVSPQDGPSLALSPQQVNFGNQPLLSTSNAVTITLTNPGSSALTINRISSGGDFQQTNTCGTSVAGGGGTCTIQITFTPTSLGLQTQEITITDSVGGGTTQAITLTGNGVLTGGSLLFVPSKLTFAAWPINTTSPAQTALLINNGNQPVTITNISSANQVTSTSTINGFTETNNCGTNFPTVPASLNVGQSCTVAVSFTPTTTGSIAGSIQVSSNAVNATNGVTSLLLSGTGSPVFSLSSNSRSNVLVIGTTSTTFTISAAGPSTFLGGISLSCSSGANCSFSPSSISVGQSSTVTVTGLSATTANPLNFTVTGANAGETASVAISIFFADFSLAATPSGTTVRAGNNATYTITVTPTNAFNQTVLLSCGTNPPAGAICYWNPPAVTLAGTGATASSTLTITTTAQSGAFRHPPPRSLPPGSTRWLLLFGLLTLLALMVAGFSKSGAWMQPRLRLVVVLGAIVLMLLAVGCENYVNPININPVVNGTPSGTTSILLDGTLAVGNGTGGVTNVTRTTTVNLSVLPST
jgi:hypothetical protein